MPYGTVGVDELAITNAAILTALLEALIHREVLSQRDVRGVLADAVHLLESRKERGRVKAAIDLISDTLLPRFADKETG